MRPVLCTSATRRSAPALKRSTHAAVLLFPPGPIPATAPGYTAAQLRGGRTGHLPPGARVTCLPAPIGLAEPRRPPAPTPRAQTRPERQPAGIIRRAPPP